jgi:hypothetical protein
MQKLSRRPNPVGAWAQRALKRKLELDFAITLPKLYAFICFDRKMEGERIERKRFKVVHLLTNDSRYSPYQNGTEEYEKV